MDVLRRVIYPLALLTFSVGVGLLDDVGLQLTVVGALGVTVSVLWRR